MRPVTKRAPTIHGTRGDVSEVSRSRGVHVRLNWPGRALVALLASIFLLFLGVPLVALLFREPPAAIWAGMMEPDVFQALQLSLVTTCLSTVIAVAFGLPVAYILARTNFPGRKLAETLVVMPTVLPPVVAGVAL